MGVYTPHTSDDRAEMLDVIGLNSLEDLFRDIPANLRADDLDLPVGKSEAEALRTMQSFADKNTVFRTVCRGAGAYHHYIPSIVARLASKDEFVMAYTPYQPELSQGILQSIFEYQTMICELTGMDASNASVYDGGTAAAEAINMTRDKKRRKALVSSTVNPRVLETIKTYAFGAGAEIVCIPSIDGKTDLAALKELLDDQTACVYLQQPNYYGLIEDAEAIAAVAHESQAKFIMGCYPIALGLLKSPAECGADIAVGEGQPLGIPLGFGGPYLGYMACTEKLTRNLPGRIVGETVDVEGKRAYVLTLQAREQHIRREKASSSICTNQALCALTAGIYLATMGPRGIREVAEQCVAKAHYAASKIAALDGFDLVYEGEFFNEFVTSCPVPATDVMRCLADKGILGGLPLDDLSLGGGPLHGGNRILWCFTEMQSVEDIDRVVACLAGCPVVNAVTNAASDTSIEGTASTCCSTCCAEGVCG